MGKYAKAIVAIVGGAAEAALTIFAPHTAGWNVAEILVAAATAYGVYQTENAKDAPPAAKP